MIALTDLGVGIILLTTAYFICTVTFALYKEITKK